MNSSNGKANTRRRRKHRSSGIGWFFLASVLIFMILYAIYSPGRVQMEFALAKSGSVFEEIPVYAAPIRQETVIAAPRAGKLRQTVADGTRVPAESVIAYIDTADGIAHEIKAPVAGVVRFDVSDQLKVLNRDDIYTLDWLEFFRSSPVTAEGASFRPPAEVAEGQVFAAVIDNLMGYEIAVYTERIYDISEKQDGVSLQANGGHTFVGELEFFGTLSRGMLAIIHLPADAEGSLLGRCFQGILPGKTITGIIIPSSAIIRGEDGKTGVYYVSKNVVKYIGIEVMDTVEDSAAVTGIEAGTEVVINPNSAREGRRAY